MYSPPHFQLNDETEIKAHVLAHPFGCVVSADQDDALQATHMPFVLDAERNVLISHMARANPQWRSFAAGGDVENAGAPEVLVVFPGPHSYITPRWYVGEFNVPTWNYTAVHAYGTATIITEPEQVIAILDQLVAVNERHAEDPWRIDWNDARSHKMLNGLVAYEIAVSCWEGKQKLNQNKTAADRDAVITALRHSPRSDDQEIAALMTAKRATDVTVG